MAEIKVTPLRVAVIGAGVGGLTAAAALRRSGHDVTVSNTAPQTFGDKLIDDVQVFEQSRFSAETGAAIHVGANASRILHSMGYDPERLSGVPCRGIEIFNSKTAEKVMDAQASDTVKKFGHPWWFCHRVDLHNELKHLAFADDIAHPPCKLLLSHKVSRIDPESGLVTLSDASTYQADLIVAADGIHSSIRETIFDPTPLQSTGSAAYRFILKTSDVTSDSKCIPFDTKDGRCMMFPAGERRIVIYPCRNFELLNFVCIHPQESQDSGATDWNTETSVERVLETYKDFSPRILAMLEKAKDVKCWQLLRRDKIDSWVKGRVCLVGDAAHPVLPHQGQGGGQAIEDGAALGALFTASTTRDHVPDVLKLYQQVRYSRATNIEWLSATQAAGSSKLSQDDVQEYIFRHDVVEYARGTRTSALIV